MKTLVIVVGVLISVSTVAIYFIFYYAPIAVIETNSCNGIQVSLLLQEQNGIGGINREVGHQVKKKGGIKKYYLPKISYLIPTVEFENGFRNTFEVSSGRYDTGFPIEMDSDDYELKEIFYVDPAIFSRAEFQSISECIQRLPTRVPYKVDGKNVTFGINPPEYLLYSQIPASLTEIGTNFACGKGKYAGDKYSVIVDDRVIITYAEAQNFQSESFQEPPDGIDPYGSRDRDIIFRGINMNTSSFVGYINNARVFVSRKDAFYDEVSARSDKESFEENLKTIIPNCRKGDDTTLFPQFTDDFI